jgi:UDP-N-acetylglucosamine--N-acetylmuramyl-(pentapeptide) pyrophosphoryl-undecaprenol N-acetylglucosamine transferase
VRLVIAGGGTAGHVSPGLAVAEHLSRRGLDDIHFVGTSNGPEAWMVPAAGFPFTAVERRPALYSTSRQAYRMHLARAVESATGTVDRADVVLGTGAYGSGPAIHAAVKLGRPFVLYEADVVPGFGNRLFSRCAAAVTLAFGSSARLLASGVRRRVVGHPVRAVIAGVPARRAELREEAWSALGLDPGRRTVLGLGGTAGASSINEAIVRAAEHPSGPADPQFLLIAGRHKIQEVERRAQAVGVVAVPWMERMELAYACADLVVSRAGFTVGELAACALPSILVPYLRRTSVHQVSNAAEIVRAGAAECLDEAALDGEMLARRVSTLLSDRPRLALMAQASGGLHRPRAADDVVEELESAALSRSIGGRAAT